MCIRKRFKIVQMCLREKCFENLTLVQTHYHFFSLISSPFVSICFWMFFVKFFFCTLQTHLFAVYINLIWTLRWLPSGKTFPSPRVRWSYKIDYWGLGVNKHLLSSKRLCGCLVGRCPQLTQGSERIPES